MSSEKGGVGLNLPAASPRNTASVLQRVEASIAEAERTVPRWVCSSPALASNAGAEELHELRLGREIDYSSPGVQPAPQSRGHTHVVLAGRRGLRPLVRARGASERALQRRVGRRAAHRFPSA